MKSTVLSTLELEAYLLQHGGQVPALGAVEAAKQLSGINPFGGILWKLDL